MDWSEYQVELYPLARKLMEQMTRHEWDEAEQTANRLALLAYKLSIYANEKSSNLKLRGG